MGWKPSKNFDFLLFHVRKFSDYPIRFQASLHNTRESSSILFGLCTTSTTSLQQTSLKSVLRWDRPGGSTPVEINESKRRHCIVSVLSWDSSKSSTPALINENKYLRDGRGVQEILQEKGTVPIHPKWCGGSAQCGSNARTVRCEKLPNQTASSDANQTQCKKWNGKSYLFNWGSSKSYTPVWKSTAKNLHAVWMQS